MGGSTSKSDAAAYSSFTTSESKCLQQLLSVLCGQGHCKSVEQQMTVLQDYLPPTLSAQISSGLFAYMQQVRMLLGESSGGKKQQSKAVTERDFAVTMAHALKGNAEETAQLIVFLASGSADSAEYSKIFELYRELLTVAMSSSSSQPVHSWHPAPTSNIDAFTKCLLHDLACTDGRLQCDLRDLVSSSLSLSSYDVEKWLTMSVSALYIVHSAFAACFLSECGSQLAPLLPVCSVVLTKSASYASDILDAASVAFLDRCLPFELRGTWRQLFSSSAQGESFQALVRNTVDKGPTVLVLRDRDGSVFGGFASVSWNLSPQFYGSPYCFLFSLAPIMEVYVPSGLNKNYMYLNQNQQTLPNGLAMGGQFGYFGLYLDPEYGKGSSQAKPKCSTYGSPQLSQQPEFHIQSLEVWSVGRDKEATEDGAGGTEKKSILDADAGAKAMLNMIDKGNLSEDIRKEKPGRIE